MAYARVKLGPTEEQMNDLVQGTTVKLSPQNYVGEVEIHLTKLQLNRLQAAAAKNRDMSLKLSKAQVKHLAKHGAGWFSNLAKKALEIAKPVAADLARKGINAAANYAANKAGDYVSGKIQGQGPGEPPALQFVQDGEGFWRILGGVAQTVLPGILGAVMGRGADDGLDFTNPKHQQVTGAPPKARFKKPSVNEVIGMAGSSAQPRTVKGVKYAEPVTAKKKQGKGLFI